MARTAFTNEQIASGTIVRADMNTTTAASALITKVIAGTGITLSSTGVDSGTGDVTVTAQQELTQNSQSTAYTLVLSDNGKQIFHPAADTTARTWTIPANSSVAFPVGTMILITNQAAAGVLTVAITTDTLTWLRGGGTGSRTVAANGELILEKITSTGWTCVGINET